MCVLKVKVISLSYIFQVLYVLCFSRPRYQVSAYRTIGPLVIDVTNNNFQTKNSDIFLFLLNKMKDCRYT